MHPRSHDYWMLAVFHQSNGRAMAHAPDFLTFTASRNAGAREERARSVNTTLETAIPVGAFGARSQRSFTAKIAHWQQSPLFASGPAARARIRSGFPT